MSDAATSAARGALLLCRADAGPELGGGHVMRLCALADAHRRSGGRVLFALNRASEPIHGALAGRGHEVATGDDELERQVAGFLADDARRPQLAARGRRLVDGLGASRVLFALEQHLSATVPRTEAIA